VGVRGRMEFVEITVKKKNCPLSIGYIWATLKIKHLFRD